MQQTGLFYSSAPGICVRQAIHLVPLSLMYEISPLEPHSPYQKTTAALVTLLTGNSVYVCV